MKTYSKKEKSENLQLPELKHKPLSVFMLKLEKTLNNAFIFSPDSMF